MYIQHVRQEVVITKSGKYVCQNQRLCLGSTGRESEESMRIPSGQESACNACKWDSICYLGPATATMECVI